MAERLPTRIESQKATQELTITWQDRSTTVIPWRALRLACPCAQCREEAMDSLRQVASYASVDDILMIGHYAIQPVWSGGHSTGIYTWEYLLEIGGRQEDSTRREHEQNA